jgi:hypothetical protein
LDYWGVGTESNSKIYDGDNEVVNHVPFAMKFLRFMIEIHSRLSTS